MPKKFHSIPLSNIYSENQEDDDPRAALIRLVLIGVVEASIDHLYAMSIDEKWDYESTKSRM